MSTRHRKLRLEQMEGRQLMAVTGAITNTGTAVISDPTPGDIAAYVQNGNLYVNEASAHLNSDNGVRIAQLANGQIRVMGTGANNGTGIVSVVNGAAYQDFTVTGSLYANLGGGNDLIQIGFADGSGAPSFNEMHIEMGAPQPVVALAKTTAKATTGSIFNVPDDDQVMFWAGNTRGTVTINTGSGNDWVFLGSPTIGDGAGSDNLSINTGAGSDEVTLKGAHVRGNLDIQTYSNVGENDLDTVYFDANFGQASIVDGSVNVRTGGGGDGVYVTDPNYADGQIFWLGLQANGSVSVDTGAGNDTAFLRNLRVGGNFSINTGAGADSLEMRQTPIDGEFGIPAAVNGTMSVQMYSSLSETDVDTAIFNKIGSNGTFNLLLGGGDDVLTLTDFTSYRDINLDAGAGNDSFELTRVMGVDNFFANLGDGNDTLRVTDLFPALGKSKIYGGTGVDHLTKLGAYPVNMLDQTGWEYINGINQSLLNVVAPKPKSKK